jgi:hypothetical protein
MLGLPVRQVDLCTSAAVAELTGNDVRKKGKADAEAFGEARIDHGRNYRYRVGDGSAFFG